MRICLMIEGQDGPGWEDWLEIAFTCESAGIEALFRSDHYAPINAPDDAPALDAWATVAGLAASTNRLRLGVLVSPATFRHPAVLAKTALTCDHISGGRVEVGLGAGWYSVEHDRFGFDFPDSALRLRMLEEQIEIVLKTWSGSSFDFEGDCYRLRGCISAPRPLADPHPPVVIGGTGGTRSMEIAARWADEYNTVFADSGECRRRRKKLDRVCESVGREPCSLPMSLMTGCIIGESRREVSRRAATIAELQGHADENSLLEAVGGMWVVGTPDEVVEHLLGLRDAGVERVMLQHLLFEDADVIELLGRVVAPALEDSG